MSALTARRRLAAAPAYRIVQLTQHWTIAAGVFYRDCVVELADGTLRLYSIRDDLVERAA